MAGSRIKGITVEIGGDTAGLDKALKNVNSTIKSTQTQLKDINKLLKLDPTNTELLSQKQAVLKEKIGATKEKLDALKTAQEQAKQQLESGDLGKDKYDALQREIVETEQELKNLIREAAANSTFGMNDAATATLNFARAGLNAEQAASALAPSMNLAAGEGGNLDTVSAGLVATINGFHGSFDDAGKYADVFAAACNNSALDVDSLSNAMSVAAPIFSASGYSVNDAALYIQKTRVAAYCRVSTEFEEQESSYEVQVEHYTSYISSNPEWELVEVYADDGISATNTAKREAFNRMIQDCRDGKIDMILTKSISRFSRNTVDCLKYTRELKGMNIAVFFEKENINTLDAKGEVLMTIMTALAQQESESLSANVRLGIQFRNQQGKVQINHNRFLGYTKDKEGKLIIVPEEAEIVRRIYAEYVDGASFLQIKRGLEKDGILNGAGNAKWYESNIKQILTNEKYIGDALLQKTYTVNTLDKKRVANNGIAPKYYVEGSHEAIIDRDVFLRVQAEIVRRANILRDGKRRIYSSRYALSSIVFCGHCGDIYRRIKWNNRGKKSTVWRCVSRVLKKSSGIDCPARTIHEEELKAAVVAAINDAWSKRDAVLPVLEENIRTTIEGDTEGQLAEVDREIRERQAELLNAGNDQTKIDKIGDAIISLREERQAILADAAARQGLKDKVNDLISFLNEQTREITEYSDALVRRLIEKITVYDEKITVEFKSGLEIDVDA